MVNIIKLRTWTNMESNFPSIIFASLEYSNRASLLCYCVCNGIKKSNIKEGKRRLPFIFAELLKKVLTNCYWLTNWSFVFSRFVSLRDVFHLQKPISFRTKAKFISFIFMMVLTGSYSMNIE